MTTPEAKQILLLHRPWLGESTDAETAAALGLAKRDLELKRWWEEHLASQQALRSKLRAMPSPAHLRKAILNAQQGRTLKSADNRIRESSAGPETQAGEAIRAPRAPMSGTETGTEFTATLNVLRPVFWQRPQVWLAAAAALVLLVGITALLRQPRVPDKFADFRSRMVRSALRQYSMDIVTNDMQQVRQFMAAHGAPADYALPGGLERLPLTGGAALKWRSAPVAMVCFDRGNQEMLYLFVMDRSVFKDAPPQSPEIEKVNKLMTVSWSAGDRTYVLAGPEEAGFARKYL